MIKLSFFFRMKKIIIIIKCASLLQLPGLLNLKVNWARELCLRCKFYWASSWDKRYELNTRQLKSFSLCSVLFQDQAQVVVEEEVVVVVVVGSTLPHTSSVITALVTKCLVCLDRAERHCVTTYWFLLMPSIYMRDRIMRILIRIMQNFLRETEFFVRIMFFKSNT